MLVSAFIILGIAVLVGSLLAVLHLRTDEGAMPPMWLAALHGLLAIFGLSCLALALRGPTRGLDQGTASFGLVATALIGLAALAGGRLLVARAFRKRITGGMIGIHATLAVSGFVVLLAYIFA
jgi:hypothetical protein